MTLREKQPTSVVVVETKETGTVGATAATVNNVSLALIETIKTTFNIGVVHSHQQLTTTRPAIKKNNIVDNNKTTLTTATYASMYSERQI